MNTRAQTPVGPRPAAGGARPAMPALKTAGLIDWIERLGNRLPHPFWLFVYLTVAVAAFSALAASLGLGVAHPATGAPLAVRSLVSREGLTWWLGSALENVAQFRPIPLVLTMLLGIGVAERSGFLTACIRRLMTHVPRAAVPVAGVFVGIRGNLADDASWLVIPPPAAAVYQAAGRHPVAGFCAGLADMGAGYTANLFVAGTDVLPGNAERRAALVRSLGFFGQSGAQARALRPHASGLHVLCRRDMR